MTCPRPARAKLCARILRKIVYGESDSLGDISTLADPSVVAVLTAIVAMDTEPMLGESSFDKLPEERRLDVRWEQVYE